MMDEVSMRPIGVVESCFGEKFGTPRQSGIVPGAHGKIVISSEVDRGACRGREEFSHVWIIFLFDQVGEDEVRWFVRPPRLGGNEKKGVFATRAPFRPNRIGLSLVKLEEVGDGFLEVSGLDLVDGTPVLDVKPYIPFVESIPDARGGFAEAPPQQLEVEFPSSLLEELGDSEIQLIRETLAVDPRPAYHDDAERVYGCKLSGRNVQWRVVDGRIIVMG